jgi:hypothetical protein
MSTKLFSQDIALFANKLEKGENFSFSKYADGEWSVMENRALNNKEFWFDPNSDNDQIKRQALIRSFKYKHPNYYVGISCPCCQGIEVFNDMLKFSEQDDDHLTWANLWVNSNYRYFLNNIIPIFNKRPVIIFCNDKGKIHNLPFKPQFVFRINNNAWAENWTTIEEAKSFIKSHNIKEYIFLFCCGPFGNILCHELTEFNDQNTYLDIGSTLNPFLGTAGFDRWYYMGDNIYSRLTCSWGK